MEEVGSNFWTLALFEFNNNNADSLLHRFNYTYTKKVYFFQIHWSYEKI